MGRIQEEDQFVDHQQQQQMPPPSPMSFDRNSRASQGHGRLSSNYDDDDDMSVMSGTSAVTRVTGVLLMEDEPRSGRPVSAMVDMNATFGTGGSMSSTRPTSERSNPMLDAEAEAKAKEQKKKDKKMKKKKKKEEEEEKERVRRQSKPSPADQRRIEEFQEGKSKPKAKKKNKDFMNTGAM